MDLKGEAKPKWALGFCVWEDSEADIGKSGDAFWREDNELGLHRSSLKAGGTLRRAVIGFLGKR